MKDWKVRLEKKFQRQGLSGLVFQLQLMPAVSSCKVLNYEDLASYLSQDSLLKKLIEHHVQVMRKSASYEGVHSLNFKTLWIEKKRFVDFFPLLCERKKLIIEAEKARCVKGATLKIQVFKEGGGGVLKGFIRVFGQWKSLQECCFLFKDAYPPLACFKGIAAFLCEDVDPYFLKDLFSKVSDAHIQKLQKRALESGLIIELQEAKPCVTCSPLLDFRSAQLKLASLFFCYPQQEKVLAFDLSQEVLQGSYTRDFSKEKAYIQDLEDMQFTCMDRGSSLFVFQGKDPEEALHLLKELGWNFVVEENKPLQLAQNCEVNLEEAQDTFHLSGTVSYPQGDALSLAKLLAPYQMGKITAQEQGKVYLLPQDPLKNTLGKLSSFAREEQDKLVISKAYAATVSHLPHFSWERVEPLSQRDAGFQAKLRSYQEEGVKWLLKRYQAGVSVLVADEMGLGKTLTVLAFIAHLKVSLSHLLIVPKSLKNHWYHEVKKFFPTLRVELFEGEWPEKAPEGLWIFSFSQVRLQAARLSTYSFHLLIVDEAQGIKNQETQLFSALFSLPSVFRLALSGTPLENSSKDVLALMSFLFPSEKESIQKLSQEEEVASFLKPFLLRRTKEQVVQELPEKIEAILWAELSCEEKEQQDQILFDKEKNPLEKLLRIRQLLAHPFLLGLPLSGSKFERVCEELQRYLQQGERVLLFSQFTGILKLFSKRFNPSFEVLSIDGKSCCATRHEKVKEFQRGSGACLMLLSLKVGGVGLNLTQADRVILYEPWWNEAVEQQAIDRAHRLGRKKNLMALRCLVMDSVEEKMGELKEKKKALSKQVVEGEALTAQEVAYLLS